MGQEPSKVEYAIALVGLAYVGACIVAEQASSVGSFTYRQVRGALGATRAAEGAATRSERV